MEHEIPVIEGFKPKRCAAYKIPVHLRAEIEQQIYDLLAMGLIRPSKSPVANCLCFEETQWYERGPVSG